MTFIADEASQQNTKAGALFETWAGPKLTKLCKQETDTDTDVDKNTCADTDMGMSASAQLVGL